MLSQITYFVNVFVTSTALVLVMQTGLHQSLRIDWILVQVCSLLLSCCHHVKELSLPAGWTRTHHLSQVGSSALELLR